MLFRSKLRSNELAQLLRSLAGMLGLLQRDANGFLQAGSPAVGGISTEQIEAQITARAAAKKAKNYAEADRIRKELVDAGVVLEDTAKGTVWRRS